MKNFTKDLINERTNIFVLLFSLFLSVLYICYGNLDFSCKIFNPANTGFTISLLRATFPFISMLILGFLLPLLSIKIIIKEKPENFGLRIGNFKQGIFFSLIIILFAFPLLWITSKNPSFISKYPVAREMTNLKQIFIIYEILYITYYIGWEFLYRGFLLLKLKDRFGVLNAILVQTFISCLMHIGKPYEEIWISIPAGIIFGFMVIKTRSIIYPILTHWIIGVILDIFIFLRI